MNLAEHRWIGYGAALLLLLVYGVVWRPARTLLTAHGAYPLLLSINRAEEIQIVYAPDRHPQTITVVAEDRAASFHAPAGVFFLLPALFLIGRWPGRRYWFSFWLYHLGLGGVSLGALGLGVAGVGWGFALFGFVHGYVLPATSLAAPALLLLPRCSPSLHPGRASPDLG